jgi:hypothetical protein
VTSEIERDGDGRYLPGVSGNPAGRARGTSFGALIEMVLNEILEGSDGMTRREALVRALVDQATEGNVQALKELLARLWPVSNLVELQEHREPVHVRPARTLEHMREVMRIANEVIGVDVVSSEAHQQGGGGLGVTVKDTRA